MNIPDEPRLPRVDRLPPNIVLLMLGKVLAEAYRVPPEQPMPEQLSRIVNRLRHMEEQDSDLN
jgi:hypothetical protein